jgi:hypothetical protein
MIERGRMVKELKCFHCNRVYKTKPLARKHFNFESCPALGAKLKEAGLFKDKKKKSTSHPSTSQTNVPELKTPASRTAPTIPTAMESATGYV